MMIRKVIKATHRPHNFTYDLHLECGHVVVITEREVREVLTVSSGLKEALCRQCSPNKPPPTDVSRILLRLEEIVDTEYGPLDMDKVEDDIHEIASAVLFLIKRDIAETNGVLHGQHLIDPMKGKCLLCGKTSIEISVMRGIQGETPCSESQ